MAQQFIQSKIRKFWWIEIISEYLFSVYIFKYIYSHKNICDITFYVIVFFGTLDKPLILQTQGLLYLLPEICLEAPAEIMENLSYISHEANISFISILLTFIFSMELANELQINDNIFIIWIRAILTAWG